MKWTQYSLFECDLDELKEEMSLRGIETLDERQLVRLRHKVESLMDKSVDSVIIYHVCGGCHRRLERLGVSKRLLDKQDLIV